MIERPLFRCWFPALLLTACAASASAQCSTSWLIPNLGFGVAGTVETIAPWDPDGSGPLPAILVLGGQFGQAGSVATSNLAFYDPAANSLSAPATGPNGRVLAVVGMANGDLLVGGEFSGVGVTAGTRGIVRWDGSGWSSLAGGVVGTVRSLLQDASGDLIVGGSFQSAGAGIAVNNVARWDGTGWSPLGAGVQQPVFPLQPPAVESMIELPGGDLLVGGNFAQAGGAAARTVARWNGSAWSPFDAGLGLWLRARQLFQRSNGTIYAAGDVFSTTSTQAVVEWNGSSWVTSSGFPSDVRFLSETAGGTLLAVTFRTVAAAPRVLELQAGGWVTAAAISASGGIGIFAVAPLPGQGPDDLVVGGSFSDIAGQSADNLGRRIGGSWMASGISGPDAPIRAFANAADGTLYVGGQFTSIDGIPLAHIAAWDGSNWRSLGSGVDARVDSIAVAPDGDVYAAGLFQNAGSVPAPALARWDGSAWHAVTGGPFGPVQVHFLRDGALIVAGQTLMRRDASGWQTIPTGNSIYGIIELPDGRIAATGGVSSWNNAPGGPSRTAIWDGMAWQPLPFAHSIATDLAVAPNGQLVIAAPFFNGDRIARWDGAAWQPLGAGLDVVPDTLHNLPNGQIVAGGRFTTSGTSSTPNLANFDGALWRPLGASAPVLRAHFAPTGVLYAATQPPTPQLLRRTTTCPANILALPSGCAVGVVELKATDWPYVGGVYRAVTTGLANSALALDLFGVSSNPIQLSSLLPTGAPGCTVVPVPGLYGILFPTNGIARSALPIPSATWLTGLTLWHQVLPVQLDAQGNLLGATTSNPLLLTIGRY